jgi:hypothetical protein
MENGRMMSAALETGASIKAAMFIDASYEGDLLAAAGVSYRVGREPRSAFNESLAGQWQQVTWKHTYQFCRLPISPYVIEGDPTSGLLPEISSDRPCAPGDGDYRVQAYNFRMHLSDRAGRIPFPKPKGYDSARYALLARFLTADPRIQWTLNYTTRPMTDGPVQMRNGDSNNAGSFSSDYVGGSHLWPDGTYKAVSFSDLPPPRRGLSFTRCGSASYRTTSATSRGCCISSPATRRSRRNCRNGYGVSAWIRTSSRKRGIGRTSSTCGKAAAWFPPML